MARISLSKALKVRADLTKQIALLTDNILREKCIKLDLDENQRNIELAKRDIFDNEFKILIAKRKAHLDLSILINKKNAEAGIISLITELEILKTENTGVKSVLYGKLNNANNSSESFSKNFGENIVTRYNVWHIKPEEFETLLKEYEKQIRKIQDNIDELNGSTTIEVEDVIIAAIDL